MKLFSKILLIVFLMGTAHFTGCIQKEQYPVEPVIGFTGFGIYPSVQGYDSMGVVQITYTDGDGDIGLYDYDTVEPYRYNYFLKFMQMNKGVLEEIRLADSSLNFNARIPMLTPSGKNKNIRGEISMFLELYYAWPILTSDTVAFEIFIRDRALHMSNVVQTPLYILNRP
jgi:hypothetical protein